MRRDPLGKGSAETALDAGLLRRLLRRHLRVSALLLEEPPRRPTLIAHALKDLSDLAPLCERAAGDGRRRS